MRVLLSELHCPPRLMGLPTPKHLLLLLLFLTGLSPSWAADPCLTDALRRLTESGHTRVGDHTAFRTNRGIDSYKKLFGAEFEQDLDRLSSKAHWLDCG